jgi:hypothetical protein
MIRASAGPGTELIDKVGALILPSPSPDQYSHGAPYRSTRGHYICRSGRSVASCDTGNGLHLDDSNVIHRLRKSVLCSSLRRCKFALAPNDADEELKTTQS